MAETIRTNLVSNWSKRRYTECEIRGVLVRLQSLTELERSTIEAACQDNPAEIKIRLIAASQVDENDKRIWDDSKEDRATIGALDSAITNAMFTLVAAHCGISAEDVDTIEGHSKAPTE